MAKRYSGRAVITVLYQDRGDYKATVAIGKRNVWSGRIGAPASGFGRGIAYDSPAAYDRTAEAALSFAEDETGIVGVAAEYSIDGQGWHVGRSHATRHAKVANPSRKRRASKRVANPRGTPKDAAERWTIRRVTLNAGGYDRFGEYFGRGAPLYAYEGQLPVMKSHLYGEYGPSSVGRDVYGHVRASDRASAIAKVLQKYPSAKFYGVKKVANPARKRKPAAKRSWRVVVARDGRSLSVGSHVYEIVNATTRDGAMKAALKRHDSDARIVSLTEVG